VGRFAALNHAELHTNALTQWVAQQCRPVPLQEWSSMNPLTITTLDSMQLFDCAG